MNSSAIEPERDESPSATGQLTGHTDSVFESFFERSFDAVWLFDPQAGVFVDCNQAAVQLIGAENKQQLLQMRPEDISPSIQPNGSSSNERTAEIIASGREKQRASVRMDDAAHGRPRCSAGGVLHTGHDGRPKHVCGDFARHLGTQEGRAGIAGTEPVPGTPGNRTHGRTQRERSAFSRHG